MASGRPSSRAHTSARTAPFSAVSAKSGSTARARSTNNVATARRRRGVARQHARSRAAATGQRTSPLTRNGSRLVARIVSRGQARKQVVRQLGAAVQHVLAVVQDEQHVLVCQRVGEGPGERGPAALADARAAATALATMRGSASGAELDQPDPIGVAAERARCHLKSQACLADTAWANQREQPRGAEPVVQAGDLEFPADEATELSWDIVAVWAERGVR